MKRLANYAISIMTAITTIVAFVGFITSKSMATWAKNHSEVIFYGLIFFFMATGASLNYLFEERRKYRQLKEAAARAKPSEHDRKLFQSFITMLPPNGPVIEWLKEYFLPSRFLDEHFKVIETVLRNMRLRALEFDDPASEASFNELHKAMQKFDNTTLEYMWLESNSPWLQVPREWDEERYLKALDEIKQARLELVEKYDNFLDVAHKNRIDQ